MNETSKTGSIKKMKKPKRKSKRFRLFNSPKSEPSIPTSLRSPSSLPPLPRKHHRANSESSRSQFDRLKSMISNMFPKKSVELKPKQRKQRSNSFTFRRTKRKNDRNDRNDRNDENGRTLRNKSKSKNSQSQKKKKKMKKKKNIKEKEIKHLKTYSCNYLSSNTNTNHSKNMSSINNSNYLQQKKHRKANTMIQQSFTDNILEVCIEEPLNALNDENIDIEDLSETEEYKGSDYDICSVPVSKLKLAPKSSSFMRSFDKRPEYTTYYPPPSLVDAFNTITVNEEERSITVETKSGIKTRLDSVDQLFEFASSTLDYSNFYGYLPDQIHPIIDDDRIINDLSQNDDNNDYELNEPMLQINDISILSSLPDDEYDDEYQDNHSWQ